MVKPSDLIVASSAQGGTAPAVRNLLDCLVQEGVPIEYRHLHPATQQPGEASGWSTLDGVPHLLSLAHFPVCYVPHLLTDLRRLRRCEAISPLFLVDRAGVGVQRLIASSDVAGTVCAADRRIAGLGSAVLHLINQQDALDQMRPWIDLAPPADACIIEPDAIPLLAALKTAPNQDVAAHWSCMSRSSVGRLLAHLQETLGLPAARRRGPADWFAFILEALGRPSIT